MRETLLVTLLVAGCSSPPEVAQPRDTPFATAYLARDTPDDRAAPSPGAVPAAPPARTRSDEIRGLLEAPPERRDALKDIAENEDKLDALLVAPVARTDLEALAWLRSPAVRAARERLAAARTGYAQSADLEDLVALYRSFLRETSTRVGPEKGRRATESIAPYPAIDALSGELVEKSVAIAFEELRAAIRDIVAGAERAHADAARLAAARRVVRADVELHDALVEVLRARLESGKSTQAALLAFEARRAALRTELDVLGEQEAAVRARWNRLLDRPEQAPANLDVAPSAPGPDAAPPDPGALRALALAEHQAVRSAGLRAARQGIAVRLAETMTLPRLDLGPSRFERERAGEAGVQRGAVFPGPGRMVPPRADFGVREAQVAEMRARERAAVEGLADARNAAQVATRAAYVALDAARRRWQVHDAELVPLAERAYEATRGSYEGNRASYIELLDSARRMLRVRLGRVDARRDHAHARARLLQAVGVRPPNERRER